MIVKISGKIVESLDLNNVFQPMPLGGGPLAAPAPPDPSVPDYSDSWQIPDFSAVKEKGPSDVIAEWILNKIGDSLHHVGMFLLHVSPDVMIILGMIGCLGVIMNIKNSGKFTAGALIASIVLEIFRVEVGA